MRYNVVIVEDESAIRELLKAKIKASDDFKVVGELAHPATLGGVAYSKLVQILERLFDSQKNEDDFEHLSDSEKSIYVILDLNFGEKDEDYVLGLEVAAWLTNEYKNRAWVRTLIVTNHNSTPFWQELYGMGIRVMAPKTYALPNIINLLEHLVLRQDFLEKVQVRKDPFPDDTRKEIGVAKYLAMGYSLDAIKSLEDTEEPGKKKFPSATTQKSTFSSSCLEQFVKILHQEASEENDLPPVLRGSGEEISGFKKLGQWGDALFLIYALRQGEPDVINYIERLCKVRITVPPSKKLGRFGVKSESAGSLNIRE